jgi:hypothetical protein
MFLITIPQWAETLSIALYILLIILGITFVFKTESKGIKRFLLSIMCVFIPFFSIAYIIYALLKKNK